MASPCSPCPAKDGSVDLLIGVDCADLHNSFVDIFGNVGEPVARLGPLGLTCIGPPDGRAQSGTRTHTIRMLLTKDTGQVVVVSRNKHSSAFGRKRVMGWK